MEKQGYLLLRFRVAAYSTAPNKRRGRNKRGVGKKIEKYYRITPHIRPWPYIRYKAIWHLRKCEISYYIRPWPSISVIRPPSLYKARGEYFSILEIGWNYSYDHFKVSKG